MDYDDDNDGLIDVRNLAQLDAIRHDLNGNGDAAHADYVSAFPNRVTSASGRMGCPSGACTGYELRADLTFDENGDGQMTMAGDPTYWNSGSGWVPIGSAGGSYGAEFVGNGRTISYLYVNRTSTDYCSLLGYINSSANIEGVGLPHADVRGRHYAAILTGVAQGTISKVWATGTVSGSQNPAALAGWSGAAIRASWSTATVSGGTSANKAGGLVGEADSSGSITASWSAGRVDSTNGGGLTGGGSGTVTNSYWDTQTSGQSASGGGTAKTTRELQRPTAYGSTGIYSSWNLNLDGNAGGDDPWDFGTNREYPALKFAGRTAYRGPSRIEADHWNAPVAGEPVVVGLRSKMSRAEVSPPP